MHATRRSRALSGLCTLACGMLLSLASTMASAELRIGVTVGNLDNYIAYLVEAMKAHAAGVDGGATLQVENASSDVGRQLSQVENFIAQKVDVLIVNPADTAATAQITARATAAGIGLVYLNSRPEVKDFPSGVAFVGTDERAIGRMQMKYLAEKMNGKGNLAIILGRLAHDDTRKRTQGVKDVLADYPQIKVVVEDSADWQRDKGLDLMNNWLLAGKDIDAVAANNDEMGIGAAMALGQSHNDKILVGGIDGTPDGLVAIARKQLAVTVLRDPVAMGNAAVDAAVRLAHKESLHGDIWIPLQLVTFENHAQFKRP